MCLFKCSVGSEYDATSTAGRCRGRHPRREDLGDGRGAGACCVFGGFQSTGPRRRSHPRRNRLGPPLTFEQKLAGGADGFEGSYPGEFPRIEALNWWAQNKGGDYDAYPDSSTTYLDGFKRAFDQPYFDAKVQLAGNCAPLAPTRVTLKNHTLSWTAVPNAAKYEVWRGAKRVGVVTFTSLRVAKAWAVPSARRQHRRLRASVPLARRHESDGFEAPSDECLKIGEPGSYRSRAETAPS